MKKRIGDITMGFLIGLIVSSVGICIVSQFETAKDLAIWSNRYALETDLRTQIEKYHEQNGHYPESLDSIQSPAWEHTEQRRKMLLKVFYYENRGDTYVLWWPRENPYFNSLPPD